MSGVLISQYESGIKSPKIVSLKKIAIALDVSIHYFLDVDNYFGMSFEQLKVYADSLDMSIPHFLAYGLAQAVEVGISKLTGRDPKILNNNVAEVRKLDKEAYGDEPPNFSK